MSVSALLPERVSSTSEPKSVTSGVSYGSCSEIALSGSARSSIMPLRRYTLCAGGKGRKKSIAMSAIVPQGPAGPDEVAERGTNVDGQTHRPQQIGEHQPQAAAP